MLRGQEHRRQTVCHRNCHIRDVFLLVLSGVCASDLPLSVRSWARPAATAGHSLQPCSSSCPHLALKHADDVLPSAVLRLLTTEDGTHPHCYGQAGLAFGLRLRLRWPNGVGCGCASSP